MNTAHEVHAFGNMTMPNGMLKRPLLSFVLFAYNQELYIRDAVEAAFAQAYSPLEIIISDDCSTDRTFDIIMEMAAVYDGPHRVIVERMEENLGKSRFGRRIWQTLRQANGDLIVIAGGDDISLPHRTDTLFSLWDANGRGRVCLHSRANIIDQNGMTTGKIFGSNTIAIQSLAEFLQRDGRGLLGATNAVSAALLESFGPLIDRLLIEDGALAFRAKLADGILFSDDCLVKYRRHSENITVSSDQMHDDSMEEYGMRLFVQHIGYLSDYLSLCHEFDDKLMHVAIERLHRSRLIAGFRSKSLLARLRAVNAFADRFPLRTRLRLLINAFLPRLFSARSSVLPVRN